MEENKLLKDTLRLDFAKTNYQKSEKEYSDTIKKFSSLLICLSSIITAVAGLFTCYCICSPKNSVIDYYFFALNVVVILATLFTDLYGYGMFDKLKKKDDTKNGRRKSIKKETEEEKDNFGSMLNMLQGETQNVLQPNAVINTYISAAQQLDKKTEQKKRILKIAMFETAIEAFLVLATVIILLVT